MAGSRLKKLSCGALFSGIGGFCFGFEAAGLKTLCAVDNNEAAIKTYGLNFQHVETICDDIIKLNDKKTKLTPVDILHAGFPCQSFSVAGNRRGFDDPRGKVFFEILRFIKNQGDKKPGLVILENSPNIIDCGHGTWFDTIRVGIQKAGYWFGI